jgi:hypothetical protein
VVHAHACEGCASCLGAHHLEGYSSVLRRTQGKSRVLKGAQTYSGVLKGVPHAAVCQVETGTPKHVRFYKHDDFYQRKRFNPLLCGVKIDVRTGLSCIVCACSRHSTYRGRGGTSLFDTAEDWGTHFCMHARTRGRSTTFCLPVHGVCACACTLSHRVRAYRLTRADSRRRTRQTSRARWPRARTCRIRPKTERRPALPSLRALPAQKRPAKARLGTSSSR